MADKNTTSSLSEEQKDDTSSGNYSSADQSQQRKYSDVEIIAQMTEHYKENQDKMSKTYNKLWEGTVKQFNDKISELNKEIVKLKIDIDSSSIKSFTILAIFASVFTFISVNINIFNKITEVWLAVAIMCMNAFLSLAILSVPLIIINISNFKDKNAKNLKELSWKIFWIGLSLLFLPLVVSFFVSLVGSFGR